MSDFELYAFEPGQQVQCKTRFDDVYRGQVMAFDLPSRILILKSPTSGLQGHHDLHFLVLDSISDVQILEEPRGDCAKDQLPSIEMKYVESKMKQARADRLRLLEAVGNGCSQEGIQLYTELSKTFDRSVEWMDKVKIVVLQTVVINPSYSEADCQLLPGKTDKNALVYVKSNVRKFWDGCAKTKQQSQQQTQPPQQPHPQARK